MLPDPGTPGTFRLLLAWTPDQPGYLTMPHSVLAATIDETSAKKDSFDVMTFRTRLGKAEAAPTGVDANFVRAALTKPAEQCQVLENGQLQLVSP